MGEINKLIHEPARLRIMAALAALDPPEQMSFPYLRDLLALTNGNLGAHLVKLELAGYIHVDKRFLQRKPHTFIAITRKGRKAFADHVAALEEILGDHERRGEPRGKDR